MLYYSSFSISSHCISLPFLPSEPLPPSPVEPNIVPQCSQDEVVGLALDAVLFALITIQILIIQTQPFIQFQVSYRRMLAKAHL